MEAKKARRPHVDPTHFTVDVDPTSFTFPYTFTRPDLRHEGKRYASFGTGRSASILAGRGYFSLRVYVFVDLMHNSLASI